MVYYLQNNSNNNRVCNQQHSGFCSCCGVDVTRFRYSTVIPSSRSTVVLTMETWQPWVLVPLCTTTMNIHPSNDPTNIFFFLFYQPIHSLARSLQQCFETSITTKRSHSFSTIASLRSLALYLKSHYQLWWLISLYLFSLSNNIRMYIQTRLAEKKKKQNNNKTPTTATTHCQLSLQQGQYILYTTLNNVPPDGPYTRFIYKTCFLPSFTSTYFNKMETLTYI